MLCSTARILKWFLSAGSALLFPHAGSQDVSASLHQENFKLHLFDRELVFILYEQASSHTSWLKPFLYTLNQGCVIRSFGTFSTIKYALNRSHYFFNIIYKKEGRAEKMTLPTQLSYKTPVSYPVGVQRSSPVLKLRLSQLVCKVKDKRLVSKLMTTEILPPFPSLLGPQNCQFRQLRQFHQLRWWSCNWQHPISKLTTDNWDTSSVSLPRPSKLPTSPTSPTSPTEVVKLQLATPSFQTGNWDTSSVSLPRPSNLPTSPISPTSPTSPTEVVKLQLATPSFQTDNWADSSLPTKFAKVAMAGELL